MVDYCFDISVDNYTYTMALPNWETDYIQGKLAQTREPYELAMLRAMAYWVEANDLVLDAGANIGNHSFYLASVTGCRVEAFEPNPELCEAFEESISLNHFVRRIKLHSVGVGSSTGKARFEKLDSNNLGAQSLTLVDEESDAECYDVITLDSLSFDSAVRLIKVDVEGMELNVLRGAAEILRRDRPIIFVEAQTETDFSLLMEYLRDFGYFYQDTFNATPTHLFLHESELTTSKGRLQTAKSHTHLRSELQANRERLVEANKKYRDANERIRILKSRLDEANAKYQKMASDYTKLKEEKVVLAKELSERGARFESEKESNDNLSFKSNSLVHLSSGLDDSLSADVVNAIEERLREACPQVTLQFGIGPSTLPLARAFEIARSGRFYCVAEPSDALDILSSRLMESGLEKYLTILPASLEEWSYVSPVGSDIVLKSWFSESVLESLPLLDWVVVDASCKDGDSRVSYLALPSVLEQLAPGAELWVLGASDNQVHDVMSQWSADFPVNVQPSLAGEIFRVWL